MTQPKTVETPAWVADAVFYQVFPDRFARSAMVPKPGNLESWDAPPTACGFKGGDLEGVREHLDYLQDLGINALYFTPIFSSTANHRYHTYDYLHVDPILGGDAAFRALIKDVHGRGMRIVLDGVFNHASRGFFQFNHTLENGLASPYIDWFTFDKERLRRGEPLNAYEPMPTLATGPAQEAGLARLGYRAWWDLAGLPKLNFDCADVRRFVLKVAAHWLDEGIDGWRLDVPGDIPNDFWPVFREVVKARNPDAYIVGEIWTEAKKYLRGDQFDAVMNYLFGKAVLGFALGEQLDLALLQSCGGYRDVRPLTAAEYGARVDTAATLYPAEITRAQMNLLGSHDTPRLLSMARGDVKAVKLALSLLFTFPGAPCVYYGDEIGLSGGHDPECRAGFPWLEHSWNQDLRAHVQFLARQRRDLVALRRGNYRSVFVGDDTYAFARQAEGQTLLGLANAAHAPRKVSFEWEGRLFERELAAQSFELI